MRARDNSALLTSFQAALLDGGVFPVFQPIVTPISRLLVGFEVLARWRDPVMGLVSPAEFIPMAEEAGLLDAMLASQLRQSFAAARDWPGSFFLGFNVSPTQLRNSSLAEIFRVEAERAGFPFGRIHVEITETAIFSDDAQAHAVLEQLAEMGFHVALDDFGTGHSSLTWLQTMPFTKIKIDLSFVRTMLDDPHTRKIVAAVIGLGQNLGLPVVAEGVETEAQERVLARLGCDLAQGYLFGAGLPAADVPAKALAIFQQGALSTLESLSPERRGAQLDALYGSSGLSIAFINPEMQLVRVGEALAGRLGLGAHELRGRPVAELLPGIVPVLSQMLASSTAARDVVTLECAMPAGGTDLVSVQGVTNELDEIMGYSIVGIDITQRKQTEALLRESAEHYRHTVELMPYMPWTADATGQLLYLSPQHTMLQHAPLDALQGGGWLDQVHPDDLARVEATWNRAITHQLDIDEELRLRQTDGSYRWFRVFAQPRRDDEGHVLRWYGITQDIDCYKRGDERLGEG